MFKNRKLLGLDVRILYYLIETRLSRRYYATNVQRGYITLNNFKNKNRIYTKKELLGYSQESMFEVVSDVNNYHKFVPYVQKSLVHSEHDNGFKADLIVGFPPLNEVYTSSVILDHPNMVRAECHDGRLFNYLLNEWIFKPGVKDIPQSCVLDFKVQFEFKTLFHSNIANLFFNLICDQMEYAFIAEVENRYGPPAIKSHVLTSHRS